MNPFKILVWLLIEQFMFRCGGGDGGGDGGAGQREAERQKRIAESTDAVNRLFGVGGDAVTQNNATSQPTGSGVAAKLASSILKVQSMGQPQPQAEPTGQSEWERNRAAREAIYGQVQGDTRDYYSKQLEEDRAQALRQLNFAKARAGTFGSSQGIDMDSEFQRHLDRGLLDVSNRADSAASNLRSNDEQARLGLISKIVAGMDQGSATSSAMQQLASNADQARNQAMSGRMANVFADLFGAYNQQQAAAGADAAKQQYQNQYGAYFPNVSSNSGTVTKAS